MCTKKAVTCVCSDKAYIHLSVCLLLECCWNATNKQQAQKMCLSPCVLEHTHRSLPTLLLKLPEMDQAEHSQRWTRPNTARDGPGRTQPEMDQAEHSQRWTRPNKAPSPPASESKNKHGNWPRIRGFPLEKKKKSTPPKIKRSAQIRM